MRIFPQGGGTASLDEEEVKTLIESHLGSGQMQADIVLTPEHKLVADTIQSISEYSIVQVDANGNIILGDQSFAGLLLSAAGQDVLAYDGDLVLGTGNDIAIDASGEIILNASAVDIEQGVLNMMATEIFNYDGSALSVETDFVLMADFGIFGVGPASQQDIYYPIDPETSTIGDVFDALGELQTVFAEFGFAGGL